MNVYEWTVDTIYNGWRTHQQLLIAALEPLSGQQLALKPAPRLRSIEAIATHMIGARARWFAPPLGDGNPALKSYARWDRRGATVRKSAEIIQGLAFTFDYIQGRIAAWSPQEWQETMPGEEHEPGLISRPWVIWHLVEHDLHHTGEISLILGMHKLTAPDI